MYDSPENFGRDLGLMHQMIIEGRKLNLGREWWKQFLDQRILQEVVEFLSAKQGTYVTILKAQSFRELIHQYPGRHDIAIKPQDVDSAWWLAGEYPFEVVPMYLFRDFSARSEKDARSKLHFWGLRPANTLELISFSRSLHTLLSKFSRDQRDLPFEAGIKSHIVALDARRIDGREQDRCLGTALDGSWLLATYAPSKNVHFWDPSNRDEIFFLAVPLPAVEEPAEPIVE